TETWRWPGYVYEHKKVDGQSCVERRVPKQGTTYEARFCWVDADERPDRSAFSNATCQTYQFTYGGTSNLTHVVQGGGSGPQAGEFELVNETDRTLLVQRPSPCKHQRKDWLKLHENAPDSIRRMKVRSHCSQCGCDKHLGEDGTCRPCAAVCPPAETERIRPGKKRSWTWPGDVYRKRTPVEGGDACWKKTVPAASTRMFAEFCWAFKPEEAEPGKPGFPASSMKCETVPFRYGGNGPVTHRVTEAPSSGPTETTFVLDNQSSRMAFITVPSACTQSKKDVFQVFDASESTRYPVSADCTRCTCDKVASSGGCRVCERSCPTPTTRKLDPGKSYKLEADGTFFRPSKKHGTTCLEKLVPDEGTELTAKFCWEVLDARDARQLVCEPQSFKYGETTKIEHTIGGE
ncbi:MAG: hypothetical protein ABEL76_04360, partial [Bradymonadaceae bacterium]